MKNYQLYRTNVLLGGQLQLDLVTSSKNGERIQVDNVHLSPISPMVPFTYSPQENILLYKHQDNIREHYKKIEGSFYQPFVNPDLAHDWPIIYPISNQDEPEPKRYNDTYIYGCRRMNYDRYQEQFQILVPIWLEDIQESLRFDVKLYPLVDVDGVMTPTTSPLASKSLVFKVDDEGEDFNSKFSKYLFDYFKYIKICEDEEGSGNQVINVDFNGVSSVHGLEVSSGNLTTKELPSLTNNLLYRERPLMEVDNMIIESFKNNSMICKQLMNFSICFSIQDFITPMLTAELLGVSFRVSADVYVDGELLEKKDFFNNYEEIGLHTIRENFPGLIIENDVVNLSNALQYLEDYKCLDLIDKNKLSQNIIHWSVGGQNDYIFNVYGGFGYRDYSGTKKHLHCYDVYPDALQNDTEKSINNFNWLARLSMEDVNDVLIDPKDQNKIKGYVKLAKLMTQFRSNSGEMIHGIKYTEKFKSDDINTLYIAFSYGGACALGKELCRIPTTSDPRNDIIIWDVIGDRNVASDTTGYLSPFKTAKMYLVVCDNTLDVSSTAEYLKNFINQNTDNTSYQYLKAWLDVLESAEEPTTIRYTRGLAKTYPDGPDKSINEFRYVKKDINVNNYIVRYDGSISPTFIDVNGDSLWNNKIYYKSQMDTTEFALSKFKTYGGTKYEPIYPSIGYFAIENRDLDKDHYVNLDYGENEPLYLTAEHPWFDNSQVLYVKNSLEFTVVIDTEGVADVKEVIKSAVIQQLETIYGVSETQASNIFELYTMSFDWEYESPTDIYTYNYYITLKLK